MPHNKIKSESMYFKDRLEAGLALAEHLGKYKNEHGIVLAVPRGGIPVAYVVAKELNWPLEVVLTKKIGHPVYKEYAIGAASLTDYFIVPHNDVTDEYIKTEVESVHCRLRQMQKEYMGNKVSADLKGKTVIIVDDGIATGNTLQATVNVLRKSNPSKIVIAVPVSTASAYEKLSVNVDEIIAVLIPEEFYGVGAFYENFKQVSDEEVIQYLNKLTDKKVA
jgi:predicted phosphoribosyltransferase